jgi:hypothetical protein
MRRRRTAAVGINARNGKVRAQEKIVRRQRERIVRPNHAGVISTPCDVEQGAILMGAVYSA